MRLPVYRGTQSIGTLEAERNGLYWRPSAVCTGQPLERLWLHTAGHRRCLGPLVPENGLLVCRGRVSCAELGGEEITHAVVHPSAGWGPPQERTLYGCFFPQTQSDGERIAIPWIPGSEFPLPGQFCLCSIEQIDGVWYVVLRDG